MSEYVIQKKTQCEKCDGTGYVPDQLFTVQGFSVGRLECDRCSNGYIYEEVPLLDVLKMVRHSAEPSMACIVSQMLLPEDGFIGE